MGSTSSRAYFAAIVIFLIALLFLGWVLQIFTGSYLTKTAFTRLSNQSRVISELTAAYYGQDDLTNIDYLFNLEIAARVAGADAVVCDSQGKILVCSQDPINCSHRGQSLDGDLIDQA